MSGKLYNGFNDGFHASSGVGGKEPHLFDGKPEMIYGLHLQATDGEGEAATEFVFHKMPNGELFIEVYFRDEYYKATGNQHYQATINEEMKKKLIDHLTTTKYDNG